MNNITMNNITMNNIIIFKNIIISNIMNDINTVDNKLFIWKLLVDNGSFNKLSKVQIQDIYTKYDNIVNDINRDNVNDNIVEKNKKLIYRLNETINTLYNSTPNSKEAITAEEIILKRQEQFNDNLNSKRQEFDNLITIKKPTEIDFTDRKEEPIQNVDSVLSSVISSRKNDMNIDYAKINNNNIIIKIGESVDISNQTISTISNISDNNNDNNNDTNIEILNKIIEIENTQQNILNILTEVVSVIKTKEL